MRSTTPIPRHGREGIPLGELHGGAQGIAHRETYQAPQEPIPSTGHPLFNQNHLPPKSNFVFSLAQPPVVAGPRPVLRPHSWNSPPGLAASPRKWAGTDLKRGDLDRPYHPHELVRSPPDLGGAATKSRWHGVLPGRDGGEIPQDEGAHHGATQYRPEQPSAAEFLTLPHPAPLGFPPHHFPPHLPPHGREGPALSCRRP